ncbi:MAG: aminotransferase class I/II-fold pyridoxal phosphate-dependent enzyme [Acidobacteriia bacterium]|nr:aminotransferase class I/II-fold pyridoxal phosphate-dependent enzyme [Terriglobia bacterium]
MVDLRSDTVTRPTAEMRRAMAEAEVGDDVYGEDPTVNRLEQRAAEIFGKEAAVFVPTGCMGNLIAIKVWTHHGDEVVCDERSHVNLYELASMSAIAGCMPRIARGEDGILSWKAIEAVIRPKIYFDSQTALVCLENTHNMAGGTLYPTKTVEEICGQAHAAGLKVHLDGARVFNAAVALGESVAQMTRAVDSVMFCLSKGLGAPVGSMLAGSRGFVEKARVYRKMLGGGMRQAGVLAAAGLIALEKSPLRLHEDHANARLLAEGIAGIPGLRLDAGKVRTNIVIFGCEKTGKTAVELCAALQQQGIWAQDTALHSVRFVTHCDVDRAGCERAVAVLRTLLKTK